jgi:hypothetical protein
LIHRFAPVAICLVFAIAQATAAESIVDITADPSTLRLSGPGASYSLLIHGKSPDGRPVDLTHAAHYRSSNPRIATVSDAGVVRAVADGSATIQIELSERSLSVPVTIEGTAAPRAYHFENDIVPLFSRFGCNASGCHGKAEGQNGFKLSVFGFDPAADLAALTKEGRGRRIFAAAPEHSLLLMKASGRVAHGGGVRIPQGSAEYETIRGWIAGGALLGDAKAPRVGSIRIEPRERLLGMRSTQQLRVIARKTDGREIDVTGHARFQSNNEGLAMVSANGLVATLDVPGEAAIMASYMGSVDVFQTLIPRAEPIAAYPAFPPNNFIDRLVIDKLKKLNIAPSELCGDADYLRRIYLDVIGTLPTADEARRFLADRRPDRRARLVDELLERPEYADYWALKWSDLLRVDRQALGHKRAYGYYKWIRDSVAANKPHDRFARELLTAEGPLGEVAPASFYKVVTKPGEAASTVAQVFLGVRIACAECHHHPFDRWSQDDYYGMTAFFAPVSMKSSPAAEMVMAGGESQARNPRSGAAILAHALGTDMPQKLPSGDRRQRLAEWLTSPANPWFARSLANRYWAHFLGRGLVEPVDDFRATNPPTNQALLDALARHLVDSRFDVKQLIRAITASRVYQLSTSPNATNERDEQNYSRALMKRIPAEVLLDMVCDTTGVPEKFFGVPPGSRAIQLWDSKVPHYFLKLFGRPVRVTACECERTAEPGVAQVLHILNSPEMHAKLTHEGGTIARVVKEKKDDGALVDELYLTFYSRFPDTKERTVALEHMKRNVSQRKQAAEDLAWSMMNSLEFVFNH